MHAFRAHGITVLYRSHSSFWALRDGEKPPFHKAITLCYLSALQNKGKYIVNSGGHFEPLRVDDGGIYIKDKSARVLEKRFVFLVVRLFLVFVLRGLTGDRQPAEPTKG